MAHTKNKVDVSRELAALTPITDEAVPVDWDQASVVGFTSLTFDGATGRRAQTVPPSTNSKDR
ncbi:MAG TPA: hypothetical protein VJX92_29470 [Methylomirabilota bacterium]|nr:hypothetical protein [Methylomirabilota bacterium]